MRKPRRSDRHIELERWLSFLLEEMPHLDSKNAQCFRKSGASLEQLRQYQELLQHRAGYEIKTKQLDGS
jgi:hypothetical protein